MDAVVTARFFRASPCPSGSADVPDLLLSQMRQSLSEREKDVTGHGTILRVEHCEPEGDFVSGQFCRKQITNIPPQAGPGGLSPIQLSEGQGLGHLAAFRYHRPTRILLLQANPQAASTGRVAVYLKQLSEVATFTFSPVMREDAIERFSSGREVRTFSVGFASPENLEALDDENLASVRGVRLLAEAFSGLSFTITISAGRGKNRRLLNFDRVKREVSALLGSSADVKKLEVSADPDEEGANIDFLEEHLKSKAELDLPEGKPEGHYQVRRVFLKSEFDTRLPYLLKHFSKPTLDL